MSIYRVIEEALEKADDFLTAPQLMDIPEVRDKARERFGSDVQATINRVSDLLGFMWRKGHIDRRPGRLDGSKARFAYGLKASPRPLEILHPPPNPGSKPVFHVIEGPDGVTIDFEYFTLVVKKQRR